ncbi:hypothetical protein GXW83_30255 [Streptacidiphilus sp. PB12-B1b]|uniref:hypothetical protein n=1 Tax=Streptacidiphilus sp. PB12-B1b TaxID=2705012 RepID=UPI0015F79E1A|nr:hypothetical protein [Streptacidiphilus sp. PB12-B1b]QMU79360.1 hypothetical protein GXW83_30255 [Streptacidiphilus sp. PB12-B1b]
MRRTRALCLTVVASAAVLGLAACGGATKGAASAGAVAAPKMASVADAMALVSKQTSADTSAKMTMTESVPSVGTITASGSVSSKPLAMDMTMTNPQLTQKLGAGSIRVLLSGDVMYMDLGPKSAAEFGGKQWLKMDIASLGGASGQSLSSLLNANSGQDPATMVRLLTSSGDVHRVGQETVDGQQTTRYTGVVDVKSLLTTELGGQDDAELKNVLQQLSAQGVSTENVSMWVNSQSLPVRIQESGNSSAGTTSATVDYSDYSSVPLKITVPPAGQTMDLTQLLKQQTQAQGAG